MFVGLELEVAPPAWQRPAAPVPLGLRYRLRTSPRNNTNQPSRTARSEVFSLKMLMESSLELQTGAFLALCLQHSAKNRYLVGPSRCLKDKARR